THRQNFFSTFGRKWSLHSGNTRGHHFLTICHYPRLDRAQRALFEKFSCRGTFHRDRNPTARLHSHRQNFFVKKCRKRSLHSGNTGEHHFPTFRHYPHLNHAQRIDFEKFSCRGTFHRDRNPTARLHSHRQNFFFTTCRKRSLLSGHTGEHHFPTFRHYPHLNRAQRIDFEKFSCRGTFHRDRNPTARLHSHRQNFFFTTCRKRSLLSGHTGEHHFPTFRHYPHLNRAQRIDFEKF